MPNIHQLLTIRLQNPYGRSLRKAIAKLWGWNSTIFGDLCLTAPSTHSLRLRDVFTRLNELYNVCARQKKRSNLVGKHFTS